MPIADGSFFLRRYQTKMTANSIMSLRTKLLLSSLALVALSGAHAGEQKTATQTRAEAAKPAKTAQAAPAKPVFDDAFMNNEENIALGEELWAQCRHCHGRNAYPGKAPKLKPRRYKPSFVYSRITKGFRKMPPWEAVFDQHQRMSLVAYIMSKQFSP